MQMYAFMQMLAMNLLGADHADPPACEFNRKAAEAFNGAMAHDDENGY